MIPPVDGDDLPIRPHIGLVCPMCGCRALRVYSVRKAIRKLRRVRRCLACGHRFRTIEQAEHRPN